MTEIAMISYGDRIISPTVWDKALLHPSGRSREQPPPTRLTLALSKAGQLLASFPRLSPSFD